MSHLKYIVVNDYYPVVFTSELKHSDVAFSLDRTNGPITSAGFCQITPEGEVTCWGMSISLNLKSDPEKDAALISGFFSRPL